MGKADNMDRIQKIFRKCRDEKRKALVIFNSCGFPDEKSSEELKELTSNPEMLEKVAREKYLMKKPNEDIYIFEEDLDKNNDK